MFRFDSSLIINTFICNTTNNELLLNQWFIISFRLDKMSSGLLQLVATKCPTDELSFTNSAVINEKDIDPKTVR